MLSGNTLVQGVSLELAAWECRAGLNRARDLVQVRVVVGLPLHAQPYLIIAEEYTLLEHIQIKPTGLLLDDY